MSGLIGSGSVPPAVPTSIIEQVPTSVIEPPRGWSSIDLRELWTYRELIAFLVWRDVRVRYRQTALGVGWILVVPMIQMVIFTIVFALIFGLRAPDGVPFPLFNFTGMIPWLFFANGLTRSSQSLIANSNLVKKIYFPRLCLPMASVTTCLVDLAVSAIMLLLLFVLFAHLGTFSIGGATFPSFVWRPGLNVLWVLPLLALLVVTTLGVGVWACALVSRVRDVAVVLPFVVQVWMYACPIVYPSSAIPEDLRSLYALNPMASVIDGVRWALIGRGQPPGWPLAVSATVSVAALVSGLFVFRRVERVVADVV